MVVTIYSDMCMCLCVGNQFWNKKYNWKIVYLSMLRFDSVMKS